MPGSHVLGLLVVLLLVPCAHGEPLSRGGVGGDMVTGPGTLEKFSVRPRRDDLYFYPCADCHEFMDSNNEIRELEVEDGHPGHIEHGEGRIWCLSCHARESNYNTLQDLLGGGIDLDQGYQVCAGCHGEHYRDWSHGAHGKRLANWRGERVIFSCVECHNPHRPSIAPRPPEPPPPIRAGLEPMRVEAATPVLPWSPRLGENSGDE